MAEPPLRSLLLGLLAHFLRVGTRSFCHAGRPGNVEVKTSGGGHDGQIFLRA